MEQQKCMKRWQRIVANLCHPLALWHDPRHDPQSLVSICKELCLTSVTLWPSGMILAMTHNPW